MELAVAHVHGHHRGRPPLQEAVGEPAGGGAGVEGPPAGHVDAEAGQRGLELLAPPADEAGPGPLHLDGFARTHEAGGLGRRRAPHRDAAGVDAGPGLLPAGGQTPADQLGVQAPARRGGHGGAR